MKSAPGTSVEVRRVIPRIAVYFAIWTLVGLFFGTQAIIYSAYADAPVRVAQPLARALADWYLWALLAPLILRLGRRLPIGRRTWWYAVPAHFVASVVVAVLKIVARYAIGQAVPLLETMQPGPMVMSQFHLTVAWYWVILAAGYGLDYYRKFRDRELRASQLESRLAQAELQMLRLQLHPHFLFNTLHAISALVQEGETEAADRMITRLSDLLRVALDGAQAQEVPLKQELDFLQRYLEIQQIRFQERLRVSVEVAPDTLDALVPSMILQPLVENAIRHGIAPRAAGGAVTVRAARQDGTLHLVVRDDGPGLVREPAGEPGEGVGLANTRARLEHLYGAGQSFSYGNATDGGFEVELRIPFRRSREELGDGKDSGVDR
jgi:two-component system, LytTR family, sensor kinase